MKRFCVILIGALLCCNVGCTGKASHDETVKAIAEGYVDKLAALANAGLLKVPTIEDSDWH